MTIPTGSPVDEKNRQLRRLLAELGIHSEARRAAETPQDEYRRLREDLHWYQRIVRDSQR